MPRSGWTACWSISPSAPVPAGERPSLRAISDLPEGIDLGRHRDFERRALGQWLRRGFLSLLVVFVVAALLNVFGQKTQESLVRGPVASLGVTAPERVRGGLLYQATFRIHAFRPLGAPTLVLDRGWFDDTTVNTLQPEPAGTTSDGRHLKFRFPPLAPGRTLLVYISFQANPTNVGKHSADVGLYDGSRRILAVNRTQIDFP